MPLIMLSFGFQPPQLWKPRHAANITCCGVCKSLRLYSPAAEYTLTVGSPAPAFSPDTFIRGAEKTVLRARAQIRYRVLGTSCAPCIQAIPLIEEAKQKYKEVTFITVFSEAEDDVRKFLSGLGAKMTSFVACDVHGAIARDWLVAAGRPGIPSIFVVNEDSKIVWMGSPEKLDAVLATISRDGNPNKEQLLIVQLEQHAAAGAREPPTNAEMRQRHICTMLSLS